MSIVLKPCPFCGGEAEIARGGTPRQSSIVMCTNCGCRLESNESDWNTGAHWNHRKHADAVAQALKQTPHEVWCDSLPRGSWTPQRCNCYLALLLEKIEELQGVKDDRDQATGGGETVDN